MEPIAADSPSALSAAPKYFPVSWAELHRNAKALAWRLLDLTPPGGWRGIVAVTRGGLVPAGIIARELEIRLIKTVCVISRQAGDGRPSDADTAVILGEAPPVGGGEGWLVIDDLVDSGRTFALLRRLMPQARFAAVFAKPLGRPLVDLFITEVSQDTWITLPWDVDLQFSPPIGAQGGRPANQAAGAARENG